MRRYFLLGLVALCCGWSALHFSSGRSVTASDVTATVDLRTNVLDRSPVDVSLTSSDRYLLTLNQTTASISLIETASGKVLQEVACGNRPSCLSITPDGKTVLVSSTFSHELLRFTLQEGKLTAAGKLWLGHEPRGITITKDGKKAYIALTTAHAVASVDIESLKETGRIETGKWPRYLKLNHKGDRLVVGCSGEGATCFIDTATDKVLHTAKYEGINQGMLYFSKDDKFVYVPYVYYRGFPITSSNIKLGWVLTSRLGRIRVDDPNKMTSLYLDTPLKAVSDPFSVVVPEDQSHIACATSGTHELHIFKNETLPFKPYSSDFTMDSDLRKDKARYTRLELGGRPMGQTLSSDGKLTYIANYLLNCVQVVNLAEGKIVRTIPVGTAPEPSLARKGEAIFYDGQRSHDQWYSCHSCHYEGHSNGLAMDTLNDGRFGNMKMTLSLRNSTKTGPWTWHGWQKQLDVTLHKSLDDSMLGPKHTGDDVEALKAYLATIPSPPNPNKEDKEAVARGEAVFKGEKANCVRCHSGEFFTDGKIHKVGLETKFDRYEGFNPPSLIGVYDRMKFLHDGRANTLKELLTGPHEPSKLNGNGELTEAELKDLIAYLRML